MKRELYQYYIIDRAHHAEDRDRPGGAEIGNYLPQYMATLAVRTAPGAGELL